MGSRDQPRADARGAAPAEVSTGKRRQILGSAAFRGDTALMARQGTPGTSAITPRYLKLEDVAAYLSVSVPQVYALVRSGELPAVKIGGRGVWRVDRTKLDAYLENLEQETAKWAKAHPLNPRDKDALPEEE